MRTRIASVLAAALTLALAGCASADKTNQTGASSSSMAGRSTSGAASAHSAGSIAGSTSSMSGMSMSEMKTTTVLNSQGVPTPVPITTIGTGYWKSMRITAQVMTPVPFYVYNGSSFTEVKPTKQTSFHLMVMLSDRHTGVAIPYATVWAEIFKHHKLVFNERQWDMLSEYMGPHYGNDVALPGAGNYQLKLLVSAPVAALHVEYGKMWVGTHTMTSTFHWSGQIQGAD